MNGPWSGYDERTTRFLSDKLREVLGEDTAAWVSVDVDEYSDQIRLIRVRDDARMGLADESDEEVGDYWCAGDFDEDLRLVEGSLDVVLEGLREWIQGSPTR